jgi:TfoX/Sxy family transcriptional regulator of competence genes
VAYDSALADRVAAIIGIRAGVTERRMFGGIAWMLHGNFACGVVGDELIVRLGAEDTASALSDPGTRPFDLTGRPMRGFVLVDASAVAGDDELASWVDAGADYAASLPAK